MDSLFAFHCKNLFSNTAIEGFSQPQVIVLAWENIASSYTFHTVEYQNFKRKQSNQQLNKYISKLQGKKNVGFI